MQEYIFLTGIILKTTPVGEYDRHVTILTRERGKITGFAKGARKPSNKLAAATNPLSFGKFKVYEGKNSYTIADAEIQNYFEELRNDYIGACYGIYFAEVAAYYAQENNDERELLKLLYQSLKALCATSLPNPLVRFVFELKSIMINGEYPGIPNDMKVAPSTAFALDYIAKSSIEKLYTFAVSDEVLGQLELIAGNYMKRYVGHTFKSLEVLKTLG